MKPKPTKQQQILREMLWKLQLTAAFRERRCDICGAPAVAVTPGREAIYENKILLSAPIADRNLCLAHAMPVNRSAGRVPAQSTSKRENICNSNCK